MTGKQLRQKYLDFFASKEHAVVPSSAIVPGERSDDTLYRKWHAADGAVLTW